MHIRWDAPIFDEALQLQCCIEHFFLGFLIFSLDMGWAHLPHNTTRPISTAPHHCFEKIFITVPMNWAAASRCRRQFISTPTHHLPQSWQLTISFSLLMLRPWLGISQVKTGSPEDLLMKLFLVCRLIFPAIFGLHYFSEQNWCLVKPDRMREVQISGGLKPY